MKTLNPFKKLWNHLYGPMPLNDFSDYNEYWEKRIIKGYAPIIHRMDYIAKQIADGSSVLDVGAVTERSLCI